MTNLFSKRFSELQAEAEQLESRKKNEYNDLLHRSIPQIDDNALLQWKVKAKSLLARACGEESQHLIEFVELESSYSSGLDNLYRMTAVFSAARDDFDGGYLTTIRGLVQAELFDSELDQARELLNNGYKIPAAVIAGTVLETTLRERCSTQQIAPDTLDRMSADLAKRNVYNANQAKRITAMAGVRNSAAHGKRNEFSDGDVKSMIDDVERFLATHLS
jgi:hypothetical protein